MKNAAQGVIIHESLLVTLFLEEFHSLVIHPPGVHNNNLLFSQIRIICAHEKLLFVVVDVNDPTVKLFVYHIIMNLSDTALFGFLKSF